MQGSTQEVDIEAGDKVTVHIVNDCPLGGDTQMASFEVTDVDGDEIYGVDPTWGDDCVLSDIDSQTPHYQGGGKSGDVAEFSVVN